MTELTGSARDRIENDFAPTVVPEWHLPVDMAGFLQWLRETGLPGTDADRVELFMGWPAAKFMPAGLRDDLERQFSLL